MQLPIQLTDVTLRDGLQMESELIPVQDKISLFHDLENCGYSRLEVTSFVSPKWVPQFADSEKFCEMAFANKPKVETMAFVPNVKGLERLLHFAIPWASCFVAASEAFNKKNVNTEISETLEELKKITSAVHAAHRKIRIYVSTVFGCPYQGKIDSKSLFETLKAVASLHPDEITLSDTIGVGVPSQVKAILEKFNKFYPKEKTALHFHNTYGLALANIQAGYEMGVTSFDGFTGGIGGCPYAKGATGNIASEEILYNFYRQGKLKVFPDEELRKVFKSLKELKLPLHSKLSDIADKGGTLYGFHE